ncbi:MAG: YlbF family regulator [Oscillospiraceae bacterium]|nr:YlbF family regulator [Oscillospiraceae bacterium]
METIKATRELGKAIQADSRYAEYHAAKEINDADAALQELIGEFNLIRQNLGVEASKSDDEGKDQSKIDALNKDAEEKYALIMNNDSMKRFTAAKNEMDSLIREISTIISLCCDGENPDTCEALSSNCSSGCSGCSGCGG